MAKPKILVVDDEAVIRQLFKRTLSSKNYDVKMAENGIEALTESKKGFFNLLIMDLKMPGMDGVSVLREIKKFNPYIEVIIITGYPTVDSAVEAIKIGAFDFVCKPIDMEKIHVIVERCLEKQKFNISHIELSELMTLFETSKTVSATIDLDSLLGRVLDSALEITKAKKGSLLIFDEKKKDLHIKATRGLGKEKVSNAKIKPGEGISGKVAKEGKPVLISSFKDDLRINIKNIPEWEASSFLDAPLASIPLSFQKNVLGVINVSDKFSGESFTDRERTMLSVLASQAAIAIENAKLYSQLQKRIEAFKQTIQQLNRTQNQLIQTEKMAAMGRLVFGIAHEIRNPLAIILAGIEFLNDDLTDKGQMVRESIQNIMESVERANNIITDLLKFSRTPEFKVTPVNVCEVLDEAIALIRTQAKLRNVKIVRNFPKKDIQMKADPNMLRQAFLNLFINAIDAMPKGGKLIMGIRLGKKEESSKKKVMVEIADTGVGIPKDKLPKIFEPFFTTKRPGKGTGLGLSIVNLILERHNADINVESEVNKGTRFIINLAVI